jgi:N-acetylglucosaminyldiphosphoundecaprenol N-acetyl-beta-D-mannosaminyltransferase
LLLSDLCPVDGIAIIWLARLLGIPIRERAAGSDLFDVLKRQRTEEPIRVFFFGGEQGVAEAAAAELAGSGVSVVGTFYPGFGSVEEMSDPATLAKINSSHAHLLVASLGAVKGQSWLLRNHAAIQIPVRVHLGAVVNFQAGKVKRAPPLWRKLGVEWLWRIKEEPHLWRRYANDGSMLLRLLLTRVIPLRLYELRRRLKGGVPDLAATQHADQGLVTVTLAGSAASQNIGQARDCFAAAVGSGKNVTLDLSALKWMDARFLGLVLMLRKQLRSRGRELRLCGASRSLQRMLRLHGLNFLLSSPNKIG